jgi:hypothetical protein
VRQPGLLRLLPEASPALCADRRGLEERRCKCYAAIRQADERLWIASPRRLRRSPAWQGEAVR